MAWQAPKTDWLAADGVRDTDFNRIEGNILELHTKQALQDDVTIFVSTYGSDATGTGEADAPYQTINKALSTLPKNLNGKSVYIQIANGTYPEGVLVSDFVGRIVFSSEGGGDVAVNALTVENSVCTIAVDTLRVIDDGIHVRNNAAVTAYSSIVITGSNIGILVEHGSSFVDTWDVSIDRASVAIRAMYGSTVYIDTLYGQDNTNGLVSYQGSTIAYNYNSISDTDVLLVTGSGGRIYSGVQTEIPNY